ncbi:TetR/AcrR family transcriptional regulator [Novosphingobium album (ex Hu et al. 2023)]|uniref:TetR family transcriptional regulator n=1 Tax=Novosphingobium album (ex Hu et al. 2023) TaxID=2930093 RepID=A0ABT0B195_9SPHN|nr:TetR family transcriptional regulator [Novosphingobium album (ex Hu et al. 2023)]MCJ2178689.1 TetR family transcriptional regulator [Novosphingobium album (ex Hu et al. 2023)]
MADTELAPTRPGIYSRGTETVDAILKAAHDVLIEEGAEAFTVRRIATECGLRVGNVSYHFPKKEMLVQVLLDDIMENYNTKLDVNVRQPDLSDEERLRLVIVICLDDICSKRTTHLFTELWALANHNDFIAERVRGFYAKVHDVIGEYVQRINPALSPDEVHTLSLFISASMEGTTPFLGYKKPWNDKMAAITAISASWFIDLVKSTKPGDIADMTRRSS